jgi:hypothetical protein
MTFAGLLQPLQQELANTEDVLSCSAALELVADLGRAGSKCAAAVAAILEPQLNALLRSSDDTLKSQVLRVCITKPLGPTLRP